MNSAQRVIGKFGGQRALAAALGKAPSTVQYWAKAGTIPAKWQGPLLNLARAQGVELYPGEFVPSETATGNIDDGDGEAEPAPPAAQWPGVLRIAGVELPVYVLADGRRVISRTGATDVITGKRGGGNLESYLEVGALKGYVPEDLPGQWIEFTIPNVVNKTVRGMEAETFIDICAAYVRALDEDALRTDRQRAIAVKAGMFLAACSKVGFIALIDEATGYQYERSADALEFKLALFLEKEMRKWEATFPDDLWKEFGRLTNWEKPLNQRPKYWGQLVMELIYGYLDRDVADWLKTHNPRPEKGHNHHQWLKQYGLVKLTQHIWMVVGIAKTCETMGELRMRMAQQFGRQPVLHTMFLRPPSAPQPLVAAPQNGKRPGLNSDDSQAKLPL